MEVNSLPRGASHPQVKNNKILEAVSNGVVNTTPLIHHGLVEEQKLQVNGNLGNVLLDGIPAIVADSVEVDVERSSSDNGLAQPLPKTQTQTQNGDSTKDIQHDEGWGDCNARTRTPTPKLPLDSPIKLSAEQQKRLQSQLSVYKLLSRTEAVPSNLLKQAQYTQQELDNQSSTKYSNPIRKFPHLAGVDIFEIKKQRDAVTNGRMLHRKVQLEYLPYKRLPKVLEKKAMIELRALRLSQFQNKLRQRINNNLYQDTILLTAIDREIYKKSTRHYLRHVLNTSEMEAMQRKEHEAREYKKHTNYLDSILNHGATFKQFHNQIRKQAKAVYTEIIRRKEQLKAEAKRREAMQERERMRMLMEDNEQEYRKLVQEKKDSRLTYLLSQTDAHVKKFTELVKSRKKKKTGMSVDEEEMEAPVASVDDENDLIPDIEQVLEDDIDGQKSYFTMAHSMEEKIKQQTSNLTGGTLKKYQLEGLEFLVSLYNNGLNGILADEMGLGKTIQTIALIAYLVEVKRYPKPFLIAVPLSTLTNWMNELQKWAPSLVSISYRGKPSERRDLQVKIRSGLFTVCVTTYEYILRDKAVLGKVEWGYLIIDEGHRIKNKDAKLSVTLAKYYNIPHRVLLTGTPLQNNLPELWALMNFLLPDVFDSSATFDDWFNKPFANTGEKVDLSQEETMLVLRGLHKVLRPFLMRRLKKNVESQLPQKMEYVIKLPMSALQKKLYEQIKNKVLLTGTKNDGTMQMKGMNNTMMQMRKVCNHPFLFTEVEDMINPTLEFNDTLVRAAGKFELLDRMFPKLIKTGHRSLLFCQMTSLLTLLEDYFKWKGIVHCRLDGNTKSDDRGEIMRRFNEKDSDLQVFILSTRAGGLGLNLQTADTVIIFDSDWNPHQDLQAQDRAHRIGQKNQVRVFRLCTVSSIEEYILGAAERKLNMDAKVIQAGRFDKKTSAEERKQLLINMLQEESVEDGDGDGDGDQEDKEVEHNSLTEINDMLARTPEEFKLFQEMDDKYNERVGGFDNRLMQMEELPDVIIADTAQVHQKNLEQQQARLESGGRGRRQKDSVNYNDDAITEQQFLKACEAGAGDIDKAAEFEEAKRVRSAKRKEGKKQSEADQSDKDGSEVEISRSTRKRKGRGRTTRKSYSNNSEINDAEVTTEDEQESTGEGGGRKSRTSAKKHRDSGRKRNADQYDDEDKDQVSNDDNEKSSTPAKTPSKGTPGRGRGRPKKQVKLEQYDVSESILMDMKRLYQALRIAKDPEDEYELCEIFLNIPDRDDYPDYYKMIASPISLRMVKKRIENKNYAGIGSMQKDIELMASNAKQYNREGSDICIDAQALLEIFKTKDEYLRKKREKKGISDEDAPPLQ